MHIVFRRLLMLSTFLALGLLETFYLVMAHEHAVYQVIHVQVSWWITFQVFQIALSCLCVLLVFRMIVGRHGRVAMLSRMGLLIFLLCFLAYTGVIGIGTGLLVAHADALALAARVCLGPQASILGAITTYSANPMGTGLLVLSCLGWIVGALSALLALATKRDPDAVALKLPILHAKWVE